VTGWETLDKRSVSSMSIGGPSSMSIADGVDGNEVALFKGVRGESDRVGGNGVDGNGMGFSEDVEGEGGRNNGALGDKGVDNDVVAGNGVVGGWFPPKFS
jgi:hypothetical protein